MKAIFRENRITSPNMPVSILMSGPIRPSEDAVLDVIQSVRSQFPGCKIFLSTWTDSEEVRKAVDVYQAVPEPKEEDVCRAITARTIQQRQLNLSDTTPGCKVSTYRMFYGVESVCKLAAPYLQPDSKVVRIRTDSMFEFDPEYLASLIALPADTYVAQEGNGFDFFALTTFKHLLTTWIYPNLQVYNAHIYSSWNPEQAVYRRVPVQVHYLDATKVRIYILRENKRKHYFN